MMLGQRKNAFILSRLNNLSPYFEGYDVEGLKKGIEEAFDDFYELSDLEICKIRHERFNLEGTTPDDFRERIIDLGEGREALSGIRFKAMDINRPFVAVWLNFSVPNNTEAKIIVEKMKTEFKVFNPLWVVMTLSPDLKFEIPYLLDDYTILGELENLKQDNFDSKGVRLELVKEIDFYDQYVKEYHLFFEAHPKLLNEVRIESLEDLEEVISDQLLFKVMIENQFAGIIAGRAEDKFGIKGVCVLEKFLFLKFRGKGYGNTFQQLFINEMAKRDYQILWGCIFFQNQASLKTALKTGRRVVECEYHFKTS